MKEVKNMIDIDNQFSEASVIELLEGAIIDSFIEQLSDNAIELDDEMLTSFVAAVLKSEKHIDLLKAMGLKKFEDNREACLVINDFCGFLKDARREGDEKLRA